MKKVLCFNSKIYLRDFGVKQLRYYNTILSFYMQRKAKELITYIKTASLQEKEIFLQAFFDDEGCVTFQKRKKTDPSNRFTFKCPLFVR